MVVSNWKRKLHHRFSREIIHWLKRRMGKCKRLCKKTMFKKMKLRNLSLLYKRNFCLCVIIGMLKSIILSVLTSFCVKKMESCHQYLIKNFMKIVCISSRRDIANWLMRNTWIRVRKLKWFKSYNKVSLVKRDLKRHHRRNLCYF